MPKSPVTHTPSQPIGTSDTAATVYLLPGEDPQQAIALHQESLGDREDGEDEVEEGGEAAECMEEQAGGEGIGVDEDPVRDENDLADPGEAVVEDFPRAPPVQSWLLAKTRRCFARAHERNSNNIPFQYADEQTFWFDECSPGLLLQFRLPSPILLYNPRLFMWDPITLTRIPCPLCKQPLVRHGSIARPRRVVDIDSTFWIVGFRYRCPNCRHPTSRRHSITFQSWDSRILQLLPPWLAEEFPARFSSRSGMSVALFEWMRNCFQNGMGAKQFSDCVVAMHLLRYDKLRLQYYHAISSWLVAKHVGIHFPAFPPYDDTGPLGYHGYVPCATWFRTMYDKFIEDHAPHIFQHTAMLPLTIGALDHSHKVLCKSVPSSVSTFIC
jgi:hypothetical protein